MSCCDKHFHESLPWPAHNRDNIINHAFDPNPPAFYSTWNHLFGFDVTSRTSSNVTPGDMTGLYRQGGPIRINPYAPQVNYLTQVNTQAKIILTVTLAYTNSRCNKSVDLIPENIYTVTYLDNGKIYTVTGMITNIYKVDQLEDNTQIYKIVFDCSSQYNHNKVVIKSDQIRDISLYRQYENDDNGMEEAWHEFGTTIAARIIDATVVDAELDSAKNFIKGTIIKGIITNGQTLGGIAIGTNKSGHDVCLTNLRSFGGYITSGLILSGVVKSGDIDGEVEEGTGIITNAIIRDAEIFNVVILTSKVSKVIISSEDSGEVLNPVIENSTVLNATITGDDMITTGGITSGNITTGGITKGGIAIGGDAHGNIDGNQYTIINGITKGDLSTTGGIVVGGIVTGGQRIGNVIYGGIVKGGVCTKGYTTGGTTTAEFNIKDIKESNGFDINVESNKRTSSVIIPGSGAFDKDLLRTIQQNPVYENQVDLYTRKMNKYMNDESLKLALDRTGHQTQTNLGVAKVGGNAL